MAQQTAKWLLRPRGWSLPVGLTSELLNLHGALAINAASSCGSLLRSDQLAGRQPVATAHGNIAAHRCYSDRPAAAVAVSPAEPDTAKTAQPSSGGLSLPKWLRTLFPGGNAIQSTSGDSSASAGAEPAASASSEEKKQDEEDLKYLEELRNMNIEGYVEYCKKMRSGSAAPRPRPAPVARDHHDYRFYKDTRRIAYLRLLQHERIGSLIAKEENDLILAKGEEVLRDRALLEDIADRTGVYIDLEVKDCIQQFLDLRKRSGWIHRYVTELGNQLPKSSEAQFAAIKYMKRVDAEAELQAALARQDANACPLRHKLPWAGPAAVCELTGLKYTECCGRSSVAKSGAEADKLRSPAGQPPYLSVATGRSKEPGYDKEQAENLYKRFKGRAQARQFKYTLNDLKPRFRDY